ncbi:hypothetical protein RRG08_050043 [Elysia crispata]|uniref:Uncharacterized protein n=1 Tax=Elysia crispata TaxID=231223 RepID=A0AAE1ECR9_9GAST|nr:hypothetical protein RRG08_050043 [Elysia crispata]
MKAAISHNKSMARGSSQAPTVSRQTVEIENRLRTKQGVPEGVLPFPHRPRSCAAEVTGHYLTRTCLRDSHQHRSIHSEMKTNVAQDSG